MLKRAASKLKQNFIGCFYDWNWSADSGVVRFDVSLVQELTYYVSEER